ncbi:2097_t:CDS:1, partial [Paraglomus occultum]
MNAKIGRVEARIDGVERRMGRIEVKMDVLDKKMERRMENGR